MFFGAVTANKTPTRRVQLQAGVLFLPSSLFKYSTSPAQTSHNSHQWS